jgi:hypothetical protein
MKKSKGYKEIKNFLHNEIGISKQEIKDVVLEVIRDETRSRVQQAMNNNPYSFINEKVEKEVGNAVKKILGGTNYNNGSRELMKAIGEKVEVI